LHDLRGVAATKAEKEGKNPTKLLRHRRAQTTDIYLRDLEEPEVEGPSFGHPKDNAEKGE
jgi:hypothetical protein